MKTRSKGGKGSTKTALEATEAAKSIAPKVQLNPDSANPPQVFILPEYVSKEARIMTLQNPRYQSESRYLVCPDNGFFEFSKIAAPKSTPRSWLLSAPVNDDIIEPLKPSTEAKYSKIEGYITKDASLFIATAIDPLFIALPPLCPVPGLKASNSKSLFLTGEDYLDRITSETPHFSNVVRKESTRALLERRMAAVCDTVEGGNEIMYRLNEEKLLKEILSKAKKMVENGLPASMEEKLIRKALEQPMSVSMAEEDTAVTSEENSLASGVATPDTQITISTTTGSFSEASTATTSFSSSNSMATTPKPPSSIPLIVAPDGIAELLRLKTAFSYICSAYIPPHITANLRKSLAASSIVDFNPLEEHLASLTKLRQEALAARSMGDYSRKRGLEDDDENEEKRAEKRRKEEDEKKRKANESRGVKALKKVNITGMKKMSDFFKKK